MDERFVEQMPLICPQCRRPERQSALETGEVFKKEGNFILEGFLVCPFGGCQRAYPILEGVPIIVKDIESWYNDQRPQLSSVRCQAPQMREYFEALRQGQSNRHAERCLLSAYMEAHYGVGDNPSPKGAESAAPGAFWGMVVAMARPDESYKRALDLGCSVGRYTFELARFSELAIGMDLNFNMVSAAAKMQREQAVCYERRIRGRCFETVEVPYSPSQNALFIVGDALDPPFVAESFDPVVGLNLLDNVRLPLVLIGQMDALLRQGGNLILSSPYEWRADICEPSEWLEDEAMDGPAMVRNLLQGTFFPQMGLKYQVLQELLEVPWMLRHHERHRSLFSIHLIKARKG